MSLNSKSVVPFRQTNSLMGRAMIWTHKFRLKIKRKQLLRMGCQQQMDTSPERCKRQPLWCTNRSDIAKRRRKKGFTTDILAYIKELTACDTTRGRP